MKIIYRIVNVLKTQIGIDHCRIRREKGQDRLLHSEEAWHGYPPKDSETDNYLVGLIRKPCHAYTSKGGLETGGAMVSGKESKKEANLESVKRDLVTIKTCKP